jgi:hypothetical protein
VPSNSERRVEILRHILDRQRANQRTTKSEVIRHMKGMSAINTTHHLIMDLIKEGKLNVEVLNSQVHFLTVSEKYDLPHFERELLIQAITETHLLFENIVLENQSLVDSLKKRIKDAQKKAKEETEQKTEQKVESRLFDKKSRKKSRKEPRIIRLY